MISTCYIVKNEKRWIGESIEHLRSIVSEFIVVDTGSSDETKAIAHSLGAKVYDFKWTGSFSDARNFALSKATGTWVLNIDPDERIAFSDLKGIQSLTLNTDTEAYAAVIRNYTNNPNESGFIPCRGEFTEFEKNYAGYFESKRVKLFQRKPYIRFIGDVHELVEKTIRGATRNAPFVIHHYGHLSQEIIEKNKNIHYLTGLEGKALAQPNDWKTFLELGIAQTRVDNDAAAIKSFTRSLEIHLNATSFAQLGFSLFKLKAFEHADENFKRGLKFFPGDHDILFNYMVTKMERGLWTEALTLGELLKLRHPDSFVAYRSIAYCYLNLNQPNTSVPFLIKSLEIFPKYEDARIDLGIAYLSLGKNDLAKQEAEQVLSEWPNSPRALGLKRAIQEMPSLLNH